MPSVRENRVKAMKIRLSTVRLRIKIGDQEVEYPEHFIYQIQTVVTTVCGIKDAPDDVVTGNLAQTTMPPVTYLTIDKDNNIIACLRNRNSYYNNNKVILVNEDEDASRLLIPDTGAPLTNHVCWMTEIQYISRQIVI